MIGELVVRVSGMPLTPRSEAVSTSLYAPQHQMRRAAPRGGPSTENRRPSRPRAVALRQGSPCGRGSWSRQRKTAVGGLTQDHLLSVVATRLVVYGADALATRDLFRDRSAGAVAFAR